jgi:diguanylate cyclase (GGDEF)-like protein
LWDQAQAALEDAEQEARRPPAPRPSVAPDPFNLAKPSFTGRLLVLDDDPDFLSYLSDLARRQMLEFIPATSVEEAVRRAHDRPPDAVILDVHLSAGRESFSVAEELRADPGFQNLPLAFMSADSDAQTRVAAAHAGASLFISKPVDETSFQTAVQQLLALRQPSRSRVLVVDDDETFGAEVAAILSAHGIAAWTSTDPVRILETLETTRPDLLLLDVQMNELSGHDVCRILRTSAAWQDLPILFLSARNDVQSRIAAFDAGADDYLTKPMVEAELLARVKLRLERLRLIKDRADRDSLTGLMLRRAFIEGLKTRLTEARRHARLLTLSMMDLDQFKRTNDVHGHLAGDRVLATLGKLLLSRFRAEDLRGRWGGEEFILAFPGESNDTIAGVLNRTLAEFRTISFSSETGGTFTSSFSAGIASFPDDGDTPEALVATADRRLYTAKSSGRSQIRGSTA